MEVHHHGHHHHAKDKRSVSSYIYEFLLLFLAVFSGYIAEYKLEHHIEGNREKKYMQSMLSDLNADVNMLKKTIYKAEEITKGLKQLQTGLYQNQRNDSLISSLYLLNFKYMCWILPDFNDNTISQLRHSGNMRLIESPEVANEISDYWADVSVILKNANVYIENLNKSEEIMTYIFNRKYIEFKGKDSFDLYTYEIKPDAKLMTDSQYVLDAYANRIGRLIDISEHYMIPLLKSQLQKTELLIDNIKIEYKVKE